MRLAAVALALVLAPLALGCGSDGHEEPVPPPGGCAPGEWRRDDGVCIPAGLPPDMPCPPGEWQRDDGVCIPAGVPPDGCGQGFVHDGDRGCDAILPAVPCSAGLMAVPGETMCREVAPCAAGAWGDIPVEPDTEYVDASYSGMDSDGSPLKPWTSIQSAIDAASSGAIVAIAEGSYIEDVRVSGNPVRLWGVCPALVEIVATGAELAAVQILTGAAATEVKSLAIRGDAVGVVSSGSLDVLLERVWVHDTTSRGVNVQSDLGSTGIALRASLVEQIYEFGIFDEGSAATVEASVVRGTRPAQGLFGRGVNARFSSITGAPATVVVRSSLVEQNHDLAVFVQASEATVEASVIRNTQLDAQGLSGFGLGVEASLTGAPATAVVRTSLVEGSYGQGVYLTGSEATVEASVVRDTQPNALGLFGRGVSVQADATTGAPAVLQLRTSLVERNHEDGLYIASSDATVEASVVRDTRPNALGGGRGLQVQPDEATAASSTLLLRASLVEQNYEIGVAVVGSLATIESCIVRDTMANAGLFGDGLLVMAALGSTSASISSVRIDRSARAAVAVHGAHVAIGDSVLTCQLFDLNTEAFQGNPARLEDRGGNLCGCPEATETCTAASANLLPPPPLQPTP